MGTYITNILKKHLNKNVKHEKIRVHSDICIFRFLNYL